MEPIFHSGRSVECRDALLAFDDKGKPFPLPRGRMQRILSGIRRLWAITRCGNPWETAIPKLTLTNIYAVMEQLYYGVHLNPKEKTISEQGYIPALLKLHTELDAAVADAYGWPAHLTTDEILIRLLELNKQRAAEEQAGKILWLRPEFQKGTRDALVY